MTRILLLAHAPLATTLLEVAGHAFPDCGASLEAIDVPASATPTEVEARLQAVFQSTPDAEWLVLVDVFGATPCNGALRAADGVRVRVVAGVNVPMLWRALCYRGEPLEALVERAVAGGMQGVMHVPVPRRQNQSPPGGPSTHDQVDHHHQQ